MLQSLIWFGALITAPFHFHQQLFQTFQGVLNVLKIFDNILTCCLLNHGLQFDMVHNSLIMETIRNVSEIQNCADLTIEQHLLSYYLNNKLLRLLFVLFLSL